MEPVDTSVLLKDLMDSAYRYTAEHRVRLLTAVSIHNFACALVAVREDIESVAQAIRMSSDG